VDPKVIIRSDVQEGHKVMHKCTVQTKRTKQNKTSNIFTYHLSSCQFQNPTRRSVTTVSNTYGQCKQCIYKRNSSNRSDM
jgi:hypothetical protein